MLHYYYNYCGSSQAVDALNLCLVKASFFKVTDFKHHFAF